MLLRVSASSDSVIILFQIVHADQRYADAIWIDRHEELPALAQTLESQPWIGVDTEFLRERTFFPKLCLLQLAAGGKSGASTPCDRQPRSPDARADLGSRPQSDPRRPPGFGGGLSFDQARHSPGTSILRSPPGASASKPQVGYAELVKTLLDVTIPKGQTRTDWSKRPLTREQLEYAADDVLYLGEIADQLSARLRELGRETLGCGGLSGAPGQAAIRTRPPLRRGAGCVASRSSRPRPRAPRQDHCRVA